MTHPEGPSYFEMKLENDKQMVDNLRSAVASPSYKPLGGDPPAGYTEDTEIQTIRGCLAQLNKLDTPTRSRVLRYLTDRFSE